MSHAHAFSCMRTLHLVYFYIFELFGAFLIVSFFPLSLFIYVSYVYGSITKSTPSQNPFRSGASSSSYPSPSHIWFRDEDARKDFSENFSQRGVHSKRRVILADFADTNLPEVIHSQGWESMCDVSVTCPSMLIQEFYSNMHGLDSSVPLFHTRVRGTRIVVTPQLVTDVLHVPRVEHPNYPKCEHLRTMSKDEMISAFCKCHSNWGDR